jgi:hypothetical protein
VEAFVTTEATFALRGDAGSADLRCRRDGARVTFSLDGVGAGSGAGGTVPGAIVLRLHDAAAPGGVSADGQALSRREPAALGRAETGWAVEGRTLVVKARARRIEIA